MVVGAACIKVMHASRLKVSKVLTGLCSLIVKFKLASQCRQGVPARLLVIENGS